MNDLRILNLYAGIGGNRAKWENCKVTAVEMDEKIAANYGKRYPNDVVIVGDAHEFLLRNFQHYDFIWSSPPCQTHGRAILSGHNRDDIRYPSLALYEEIIFLNQFFSGKWVVENVVPYYKPLLPAAQVDRHLCWSNFTIPPFQVNRPGSLFEMSAAELMGWLGIHYEGSLYVDGNHCPAQVLRNCVHPEVGLHVLNNAFRNKSFGRSSLPKQSTILFS